jgi:hypothetical protein
MIIDERLTEARALVEKLPQDTELGRGAQQILKLLLDVVHEHDQFIAPKHQSEMLAELRARIAKP